MLEVILSLHRFHWVPSKSAVYHGVANGKCYNMDPKKKNIAAFYDANFAVQNRPFLSFLKIFKTGNFD